ncbi:hypothetical protein LTS08_008113 [Lithohypha guttulata]|nr:hypothetical protein LTS08_008113 [Lithohypha guttulata]
MLTSGFAQDDSCSDDGNDEVSVTITDTFDQRLNRLEAILPRAKAYNDWSRNWYENKVLATEAIKDQARARHLRYVHYDVIVEDAEQQVEAAVRVGMQLDEVRPRLGLRWVV